MTTPGSSRRVTQQNNFVYHRTQPVAFSTSSSNRNVTARHPLAEYVYYPTPSYQTVYPEYIQPHLPNMSGSSGNVMLGRPPVSATRSSINNSVPHTVETPAMRLRRLSLEGPRLAPPAPQDSEHILPQSDLYHAPVIGYSRTEGADEGRRVSATSHHHHHHHHPRRVPPHYIQSNRPNRSPEPSSRTPMHRLSNSSGQPVNDGYRREPIVTCYDMPNTGYGPNSAVVRITTARGSEDLGQIRSIFNMLSLPSPSSFTPAHAMGEYPRRFIHRRFSLQQQQQQRQQIQLEEQDEYTGVPQHIIDMLPVEAYDSRLAGNDVTDNCSSSCLICQLEYSISDQIRRLPCLHYFHTDCIDRWLMAKTSVIPLRQQVFCCHCPDLSVSGPAVLFLYQVQQSCPVCRIGVCESLHQSVLDSDSIPDADQNCVPDADQNRVPDADQNCVPDADSSCVSEPPDEATSPLHSAVQISLDRGLVQIDTSAPGITAESADSRVRSFQNSMFVTRSDELPDNEELLQVRPHRRRRRTIERNQSPTLPAESVIADDQAQQQTDRPARSQRMRCTSSSAAEASVEPDRHSRHPRRRSSRRPTVSPSSRRQEATAAIVAGQSPEGETSPTYREAWRLSRDLRRVLQPLATVSRFGPDEATQEPTRRNSLGMIQKLAEKVEVKLLNRTSSHEDATTEK